MKKPELSLQNRVALIAGAEGGIGRAISFAFGAAGAGLFLNGRSAEKLADLCTALKEEGIDAAYKAIDINAPAACTELVDEVVRSLGSIDILVN